MAYLRLPRAARVGWWIFLSESDLPDTIVSFLLGLQVGCNNCQEGFAVELLSADALFMQHPFTKCIAVPQKIASSLQRTVC